MDKDSLLFDDKSFSDLMRDVYNNTKKKESQIKGLVDQLSGMVNTINEASMMVPLIKEYLEISVKNDDNLVRLTAIIQRLLVTGDRGKTEELGLSDAEREQLLAQDKKEQEQLIAEAHDLMDRSR